MLPSITGTYSFIFSSGLTFPIQSVFNLTFAHFFFLLSLLRSTLFAFSPLLQVFLPLVPPYFSLFLPLFSFISIFLFHCFLPSFLPSFLPIFCLFSLFILVQTHIMQFRLSRYQTFERRKDAKSYGKYSFRI